MSQEILQLGDWQNYYENFKNGTFPHPSRDPGTYSIGEKFFEMIAAAKNGLERLLLKANWNELGEPEKLDAGVDLQVISSAHSDVDKERANELLEAAGFSYDDDAKKQLAIKWLTGHSGTMLGKDGKDNIKQLESRGQIVICSDLPRAIHCALLKYAPQTETELDTLAEDVLRQITTNKGIISEDTHNRLVELALEHNIFPTILPRAAFYGHMELLPVKAKYFDVDQIVKSGWAELLGHTEEDIRQILQYATQRSDAAYHAVDKKGLPISEDRLMFYLRVKPLLDLFLPKGPLYDKIKWRTIDIVGHSGLTDVIVAYFRHFRDIEEIAVTREPKELTQGKEWVLKLKAEGNAWEYLNDPRLFDDLIGEQDRRIGDRRKHSLDDEVKEGRGIVATPLVAEREKEKGYQGATSEHEKVPVTLEEITKYRAKPTLILGDGGQGKTTLSLEIASGINRGLARGGKQVAVFVHCEDLPNKANEVSSYLSKPLEGLPGVLLDEYEFVYVIDGLEALGENYKNAVIKAATELAKKYHVIVTSRYLGFGLTEDSNPNFRTVQIDTDTIAGNIDAFLEGRLDKDKRGDFKKFLEPYQEPIKGTFQTLFFLLELYKNPEEVEAYLTNDQTKKALRERKPLTEFQIRDAKDDLMLGRYITTKPGYERLREEPDKIREIVLATKRHMDEMAFEELTGQPAYHLAPDINQNAGSNNNSG